jgi:hypothetical protein
MYQILTLNLMGKLWERKNVPIFAAEYETKKQSSCVQLLKKQSGKPVSGQSPTGRKTLPAIRERAATLTFP